MNRLQGLPPTYCLTLQGETARQEETQRQFQKYGADVRFHAGFDGRKFDFRTQSQVVTGEYFKDMSSGDIACCMGHLAMIRRWLREFDTEMALFVEDDINLENCENWSFTWKEMVESQIGRAHV